jgi:excisionase family DNA binding protein
LEVHLMEPMLTARDVAQLLNLRESYVYAQAALGNLPSYKIHGHRRFLRSEIDAWQTTQLDRQPHQENGARTATHRHSSASAASDPARHHHHTA